MTIRTVDMQVLIPKSSEIAKLQQVQQQENQVRQQENTQQINAETVKTTTNVNDPQKSEASHIYDKQEEEKRRRKARKGKAGGKDESEEEKGKRSLLNASGHLDITV